MRHLLPRGRRPRTQQIEDLAQTVPDPNNPTVTSGNLNADAATTFFETGEGPGVVNAPVMPDVIYAARGGARPGLSVVDLNGYGQSTGNPITTFPSLLEGESRFPFDPNVTLNPAVRPALVPGDCTVDGGSAGVFTLTRDSSLDDLVLRTPLVSSVTDLHAGHALDGTIRNAPPPFGCQASGGYICASDGLKLISAVVGEPAEHRGARAPEPVRRAEPGLREHHLLGSRTPTRPSSPSRRPASRPSWAARSRRRWTWRRPTCW